MERTWGPHPREPGIKMRGRSVRDRRRGWSRLAGRVGVHLGRSHTHAPCPSALRGGWRLCAASPRPVGSGPSLARLWGRPLPPWQSASPGLPLRWLRRPLLPPCPGSRRGGEVLSSALPAAPGAGSPPLCPAWGNTSRCRVRPGARSPPPRVYRRLLESPAPGTPGAARQCAEAAARVPGWTPLLESPGLF